MQHPHTERRQPSVAGPGHGPTRRHQVTTSYAIMNFTCLLATFLLFAFNAAPTFAAAAPETVARWQAMRFGLFIHWGPVSLKGTEIGWSRGGERRGYGSTGTEVPAEIYDNLYREFNPTNFNAREWVAIAKAAGMKYLVFTSRHHDGFSMFDTQANDYKITNPQSPFRRDVVKELADACHEANLRFGLYYSQPNWQHPDAFTPDRHGQYLAYLKRQVTEICSNYGRLDILWFDGLGKKAEEYDGQGLVQIIRRLQPQIIINDRTGLPEDHDTPEQRVGKYQDDRPWESCITICQQWAWKPNDQMKSLEECIRTLVTCAGGDGNLLFNVGPMPDGRIEPRQVERLREMGAWLTKNGESIYGTRGGPWKPTKTLASTRQGKFVFVHVFHDDDGQVELPQPPCRVISANRMDGTAVGCSQKDGKIHLSIPRAALDPIDTVVRLELDRSAMELPAISASATPSVKASASNVYHGEVKMFGPQEAFDGDNETRWATDSGTRQAWIEAECPNDRPIRGVRIQEALQRRVSQFEFQYREGNTWKTLFAGQQIGPSFERDFTPVTARHFRLNILEASEGPTISEIELLAK